jgi:hypothetical protein
VGKDIEDFITLVSSYELRKMSLRGEKRGCGLFSWFTRRWRRTARRADKADLVRNAEEVQENTLRENHFVNDQLSMLQEYLNLLRNVDTLLRDELQKKCQTEVEKLELTHPCRPLQM